MRETKVAINTDKLQYSVDLMRALAHPLRLKILKFIDENEKINVRKIYNSLGLEQSITSQHLGILRTAGVLQVLKEGKFKYYYINYPVVERAEKAVKNFLLAEA